MVCYHPLTALRYFDDDRGRDFLTFDVYVASSSKVNFFNASYRDKGFGKRSYFVYPSFPGLLKLPCGQCIGCRINRSKDWAIRCVHEASLYKKNCFITLTYSEENLPEHGTLVKRDFQLFMKRLRKKFGDDIRFYQCGEYGENFSRPHYHAILFNFDFPDKTLWNVCRGNRVYRSKILEDLWPLGMSTIGNVTYNSAAYVARYILKKINGKSAEDHYDKRIPEYNNMSRMPGIAHDWFEKFKSDVFPCDYVVLSGKKVKIKPPRYYDNLYELTNPDDLVSIKELRKSKAKEHSDNNTPDRLKDREECQKARLKTCKRGYEGDI